MKLLATQTRLRSTAWMLPALVMFMGCASHRYGAHFHEYSEVNPINTLGTSSSSMEQKIAGIRMDESNTVASLRNDPMVWPEQPASRNMMTLHPNDVKPSEPNKRTIAPIKKVRKMVLLSKQADKPDSIESKKEMPRYKYLRWSGFLLLAGILFVAFSASATILGVMGTLAFTGALVFFILWILKK